MDIRFSGKNLTVTAGMKEHLQEKLLRLDKYAPRIVESHVILKKEKYIFIVEITLSAKNFRAYGESRSKDNIFSAMDQAYLRIEKQLKKFRAKVKDHHKHAGEESNKKSRIEGFADFDRPRLIRTRSFAAKPMSNEEASMQLQLSDQPFLVFQNASTQQVNVVFKREDGHHGLIEPTFNI